jgi:hypothetical protein
MDFMMVSGFFGTEGENTQGDFGYASDTAVKKKQATKIYVTMTCGTMAPENTAVLNRNSTLG